jgi:hypothetical protein
MGERIAGSLAVALAALFTGAAAYIVIAEQPARLLLDNRNLLIEWQTAYPIGMRVQGSLAILAGVSGAWAWWVTRDWRWLIGAALMLANWPYTLIAIQSINGELMTLAADQAGSGSRALIERWGTLHSVRACLGGVAMTVYYYALNRPLFAMPTRRNKPA